MTTVRTRFAPSPTGTLHLGSARTALMSYLFARHHGGEFLLRIEDTDQARSEQRFVESILEGLRWLGIDWDQDPVYQMQRMPRYTEVIAQLLETGHAYRCTCSKERLDELRSEQMAAKQKPRYDGKCRDLILPADVGQPFVVRFRNPTEGEVHFQDQVHGDLVVQNAELDDLILARSDGLPTYNLTVVADDMDMGITHVVRGDDHLNNTPRQINILKGLGVTPPVYAHMPMILGPDGKKLSKRQGAQDVLAYRDTGYLPEAMLNMLVRLGWSHGDQELFTHAEMVELFELSGMNKAAAAFNPDKLQWLNQHYIKTLPEDALQPAIEARAQALGVDLTDGPALADVLALMRERCRTLDELLEQSQFLYGDRVDIDPVLAEKHLTAETAPILSALKEAFAAQTHWTQEAIHADIEAVAAQFELKFGKVAQPLRVAITGSKASPSMAASLALLAQERVVGRLEGVHSVLS